MDVASVEDLDLVGLNLSAQMKRDRFEGENLFSSSRSTQKVNR